VDSKTLILKKTDFLKVNFKKLLKKSVGSNFYVIKLINF